MRSILPGPTGRKSNFETNYGAIMQNLDQPGAVRMQSALGMGFLALALPDTKVNFLALRDNMKWPVAERESVANTMWTQLKSTTDSIFLGQARGGQDCEDYLYNVKPGKHEFA